MTSENFMTIAKKYIESNAHTIRTSAKPSKDPMEADMNRLLAELAARTAEQACMNVIICTAKILLQKGVLHDE